MERDTESVSSESNSVHVPVLLNEVVEGLFASNATGGSDNTS